MLESTTNLERALKAHRVVCRFPDYLKYVLNVGEEYLTREFSRESMWTKKAYSAVRECLEVGGKVEILED